MSNALGSSRIRRRRGVAGLLVTALVALGVATGATTGSSSAARAAGTTDLKVSLIGDIDTFNPFLAVLLPSTGINRYQYESLVGYGKDNQPTDGLADDWQADQGGRNWTFHIPEDREWSDGEKVTADDAVYTYTSIMKNETLQEANGGLVTNVASVSAQDPQTLLIKLKAPQASNPGQEIPIVPEHVWSKQDPTKYQADKDVVGSGPFLITRYKTGQSVEMRANPRFWRGKPKVDKLVIVSYKNSDAAVQGLRSDEIDVIGIGDTLTPAQYSALDGTDGVTVHAGIGRRYQALAINPGAVDKDGKPLGDGNPALKDPQLRQAIFMAIDRKVLVKRVLRGLGNVGQTEVPPAYADYFGFADGQQAVDFDLGAANDLLDRAGYRKGKDGIRLDKQGKPLKLRLMGRNTEPAHAQMADFLESWLSDIGIAVEPTMVTPERVNEDSTLGKYDLYFTGWSLGPDPDFQLSINTCGSRPNADGSGNTSENNWCSPEFDKLFSAQHAELDSDKRAELVKQAFSMIYEAYVSDPLYYVSPLEAYRSDRFHALQQQPSKGGVMMNQNGYWGLYSAEPTGAEESDDGGLPGWVVPVAVVVVLGLAGGALVLRRRTSVGERE